MIVTPTVSGPQLSFQLIASKTKTRRLCNAVLMAIQSGKIFKSASSCLKFGFHVILKGNSHDHARPIHRSRTARAAPGPEEMLKVLARIRF